MTDQELEVAAQAADVWPKGVHGEAWGWSGEKRPHGIDGIDYGIKRGHG